MKKFLKQKNKFIKGRQTLSRTKGFTLVETLVAISIFTVSLLGIMSVLASGIANTNYAKRKMTATYLAQEGIEYVRNMRDDYMLYDKNWNNFRTKISECGIPGNAVKTCYFDDQGLDFTDPSMPMTKILIQFCVTNPCPALSYDSNTGKYNYVSGVNSGFVRSIQATYPGGPNDDIKISSTVSWTQGSGIKSVTFSENLFNWY